MVEGPDYTAARLTVPSVGKMKDPEPRISRGASIQDLRSPVGGTVIDNDPFLRANNLICHAANRLLDVGLFVSRRCHDDITNLRKCISTNFPIRHPNFVG